MHVYLTYGSLLQSYKLSSEATGWILGVYFLAAMLIRPLGGWLLENYGVRRTLVWSGVLNFVGCSLLFFKQSAALLFIGRTISGASFGIYSTGLFSYQALCVPEKERGTIVSLLVVSGVLPIAIMTPLGEGVLLSSRDTLYLTLGPAFSVLCCFFGGRVGVAETKETRGVDERSWGTYSGLFSSRGFKLLVLTGTLMALVDAIIINISLLAAEKGLVASYFLTSNAVTAVVVRLAGSQLQNVLPRVALFAPCGILMACSMLLVSLFPTHGVFVASGVIFGIGIGAGWPMLHALISDFLDPALRPKGTAAALVLYDGGFSATPLIVGYFLPYLGTAGTFVAIALVVGGALVLLEVFYWLPFYKNTHGAG